MHGRVLNNAETLAELRADVLADLPLLGLGKGQIVDLLFRVLGLFGLVRETAEAAKLRIRRS